MSAPAFAALRERALGTFYARLSCWWVPAADGTGAAPRALLCRGLPSPDEFASMLAPGRLLSPVFGAAP